MVLDEKDAEVGAYVRLHDKELYDLYLSRTSLLNTAERKYVDQRSFESLRDDFTATQAELHRLMSAMDDVWRFCFPSEDDEKSSSFSDMEDSGVTESERRQK